MATLEQISSFLNVTPRWINRMVKEEGMPKLARGEYDAKACIHWYIQKLKDQAEGKGSETFNEAKTRLTVIQANKKEFEYQVLHGEYIKITTAVNLVVDYIHRNKAKTRSIPDKWTHSFVGLEDELEIRKILTEISNELLQEQSTERFTADIYEKLDQQVKSSNGLLASAADDDSEPVGRRGKNDSAGSSRRTRKVANRKG